MFGDFLSDLRYRLRALIRRARVEQELSDELQFHLEHEAHKLMQQGVPPEEAVRRARLAFGGIEDVKESSRDARGLRFLEHLGRDLSRSLRLARRQPAFTVVVALSLALGIGATTAVWNLTYAVLFAPLELPHPEQLVVLERRDREGGDPGFSWADYTALRGTSGVGAFASFRGASSISLETGDRRETVNLHFVDGNYFALAGVRPQAGRLLTPEDDTNRAPVVVLAAWYAEKLFGDSSVVGRVIKLRGASFTVVGVAPRSFRGLEFPGWFTGAIPEGAAPLLSGYGPGRDNRGQPFGVDDVRRTDRPAFHIVSRLSVRPEAARSALGLTFARCCRPNPGQSLELIDIRLGLGGGKSDIRAGSRPILPLLLGGMGLVLVVICCNVASLLLVRASARQREIAVRLALGASRRRVVSQLVAESAPPAVLGGLGGLLVAAWYSAAFLRSLPPDWVDASDAPAILGLHWGPALGFSALVTLCCTLGFTVYPALRASRQRLAQSLRLDARASRSRGQGVVARGVVLVQVAGTVVLVSAATLFAATLGNLTRVDGGYATDHVLMANLEARSTPWERQGLQEAVRTRIVEQVRGIPGVRVATMSTRIPLFGGSYWPLTVRVPEYQPAPREEAIAWLNATVPGFFAATGIELAAGREFSDLDREGAAVVGIVNRAFARRYFAGRNPLDRSIDAWLGRDRPTSVRIVGLAEDARYDGLRASSEPMLYMPMVQAPEAYVHLSLLARTEGPPLALERALRQAIEAAAPGLNVRRVRDMEGERREAVTLERLATRLGLFVSVMALVLAAVGLYGVVAYSVARRTGEIGVRIALGAGTRAVIWLVARETLALVAAGVLVGIPLSYIGVAALRSQLYGVGVGDPRGALVAVFLLGVAGVVASVLPARRAARIDPRLALNAD